MFRWLFDKLKSKPQKNIVVLSPRWSDIWAGPENRHGAWGAGKSVYGALGNLVFNNPEKFGIEIKLEFNDKPLTPLEGPYVSIPEERYNALIRDAGWKR